MLEIETGMVQKKKKLYRDTLKLKAFTKIV